MCPGPVNLSAATATAYDAAGHVLGQVQLGRM
jgi:hypothetical protein